ncbi:MAG TPA: amidohydrolase family protein, partial [Spirochaetia bacterium]|nr:amidohydrolase family protein [Spirochaetia bacterium]
LWKLPKEKALKMIEKHGIHRFLFGSDFPMWDHAEELQRFLALGLSEEDNRAILYENASQLLQPVE